MCSIKSLEARHDVQAVFNRLPEKIRNRAMKTVAPLWGLDGPALTMDEVAQENGLSVHRIRQLHAMVVQQMRLLACPERGRRKM
jgi:DNA-directed RNA polymerase sigma subunit (sigma70/sigma32)